MNKIYISIGSNLNNRLQNIKEAVIQIQHRIGVLKNLSSIFETVSLGFEGPKFLNACVGVETECSPFQVLEKLLEIEMTLGRVIKSKNNYQSRTIDLDLLFYDQRIIRSNILTVPHPRLQLRNFVLHPLNEICPSLIHPILEKKISKLLSLSSDNSKIHKKPVSIWSPSLFESNEILTFEGNIGVGKTSLAKKIAAHYKVESILEDYNQLKYLRRFYSEPKFHALKLEYEFLEMRFNQFKEFLSSKIGVNGGVADHSLFRSIIFAKINLSQSEFNNFQKKYHKVCEQLSFNNKLIYLKKPIDKLKENIKKRDRPHEKNISIEYLKQIESGYLSFFHNNSHLSYEIINLENINFMEDELSFQKLLLRIKAF